MESEITIDLADVLTKEESDRLIKTQGGYQGLFFDVETDSGKGGNNPGIYFIKHAITAVARPVLISGPDIGAPIFLLDLHTEPGLYTILDQEVIDEFSVLEDDIPILDPPLTKDNQNFALGFKSTNSGNWDAWDTVNVELEPPYYPGTATDPDDHKLIKFKMTLTRTDEVMVWACLLRMTNRDVLCADDPSICNPPNNGFMNLTFESIKDTVSFSYEDGTRRWGLNSSSVDSIYFTLRVPGVQTDFFFDVPNDLTYEALFDEREDLIIIFNTENLKTEDLQSQILIAQDNLQEAIFGGDQNAVAIAQGIVDFLDTALQDQTIISINAESNLFQKWSGVVSRLDDLSKDGTIAVTVPADQGQASDETIWQTREETEIDNFNNFNG